VVNAVRGVDLQGERAGIAVHCLHTVFPAHLYAVQPGHALDHVLLEVILL